MATRVAALAVAALCIAAPATAAPETAAGNSAPAAGRPADGAVGVADDLDAVMQLLAARTHGEASFIEQHFLALLKRPVESSGELLYDAPGRLEKRTLEPRPETLVLDHDVLTVERGHHSHVLTLQSVPQIAPFVESIRATMAGDRRALERVFKLDYSGSVARWSLLLAPLDPAVAKSVAHVRIDGMRDELFRIEITQTDGDRSLMTLRSHPKT